MRLCRCALKVLQHCPSGGFTARPAPTNRYLALECGRLSESMTMPGGIAVLPIGRVRLPWLRPGVVPLLAVRALCPTRRDQPGVVLVGHPRQLRDEANRCPELVVAVVGPGGHAGHPDPVLQDPEQLGRRVE